MSGVASDVAEGRLLRIFDYSISEDDKAVSFVFEAPANDWIKNFCILGKIFSNRRKDFILQGFF